MDLLEQFYGWPSSKICCGTAFSVNFQTWKRLNHSRTEIRGILRKFVMLFFAQLLIVVKRSVNQSQLIIIIADKILQFLSISVSMFHWLRILVIWTWRNFRQQSAKYSIYNWRSIWSIDAVFSRWSLLSLKYIPGMHPTWRNYIPRCGIASYFSGLLPI